MSLNESIVEDATLEWLGEQIRFAQTLTRPLPRGEEEDREAICRLNPAIPEEVWATVKNNLSVQTHRREAEPMSDEPLPNSEIILYQTEDGRTRIQCRFENETVWLTQALIGGAVRDWTSEHGQRAPEGHLCRRANCAGRQLFGNSE